MGSEVQALFQGENWIMPLRAVTEFYAGVRGVAGLSAASPVILNLSG